MYTCIYKLQAKLAINVVELDYWDSHQTVTVKVKTIS